MNSNIHNTDTHQSITNHSNIYHKNTNHSQVDYTKFRHAQPNNLFNAMFEGNNSQPGSQNIRPTSANSHVSLGSEHRSSSNSPHFQITEQDSNSQRSSLFAPTDDITAALNNSPNLPGYMNPPFSAFDQTSQNIITSQNNCNYALHAENNSQSLSQLQEFKPTTSITNYISENIPNQEMQQKENCQQKLDEEHQQQHNSQYLFQSNSQNSINNSLESSEEPEQKIDLDILVHNVVCKYRTRCHVDLRRLALGGINTELDLSRGRVEIKLKRPKCSAHVWCSGKVSIYGAKSEKACHKAARIISRMIQKLKFDVKMCGFEIVNVMAVCRMPFKIELNKFYQTFASKHLTYEPEIHAAANYKFPDDGTNTAPGANLKIFHSGAITATGRNTKILHEAITSIYPILEPFQKPGTFCIMSKDEFDDDDDDISIYEDGDEDIAELQRQLNEDEGSEEYHKRSKSLKQGIKRRREILIESDDEEDQVPPTPINYR